MPKIPPFVELKNMFRDAAKESGQPISSREAHRVAQGFILSLATDEAYDQPFSDETGEEAVKQVLIEYLRKFGSLRAPEWPTYEPPALWYIRPMGDTFGSGAAA